MSLLDLELRGEACHSKAIDFCGIGCPYFLMHALLYLIAGSYLFGRLPINHYLFRTYYETLDSSTPHA